MIRATLFNITSSKKIREVKQLSSSRHQKDEVTTSDLFFLISIGLSPW